MKERFDYGQNPDKTEGGELISSYGCDHMTADAEFLLSKAKYKAATGREQRRDADVLCYQIRQSFKPGEKPDLADELADVLWVVTAIANQEGIDLTEAIANNLAKKSIRDKDRHRLNPKLRDNNDQNS